MPEHSSCLGYWSAWSVFLTNSLPTHAQHLCRVQLITRAISELWHMKVEATFCAVSSVASALFCFFCISVDFTSCVSRKPCQCVPAAIILCNLEAEKAPEKPWPVGWVPRNVLQVSRLSHTAVLRQQKARSFSYETQRLTELWEAAGFVQCQWILHRKGFLSLRWASFSCLFFFNNCNLSYISINEKCQCLPIL